MVIKDIFFFCQWCFFSTARSIWHLCCKMFVFTDVRVCSDFATSTKWMKWRCHVWFELEKLVSLMSGHQSINYPIALHRGWTVWSLNQFPFRTDPSNVCRNSGSKGALHKKKKILYYYVTYDIAREWGLMVNKWKKAIFLCATRGALALHHLGCEALSRAPTSGTQLSQQIKSTPQPFLRSKLMDGKSV